MKKYTKALVTFTALAAIGGGGLVTAGTAVAAPASTPAAGSESVTPLAVNNLGLSTAQAAKVQRSLSGWGYTGPIDGLMGTETWKAMQRFLKANYGYNDAIDGIVGPNTIKGLQRWLKANWGYTGAIDGIAGSGTQAALKRYANQL
ncbi:peptidoglycan-binding protein [Streptomyces xiamenensis]|uniref:peptidoglycan-binding domain-containing protein n=1 Tax=Streptomyces xiamenensis TaxID=408015 RepID=UPI00369D0A8F